jgi:hypothetical protein
MNEAIPELDAITAEFFTKLFQDTLQGLNAQVLEKIVKLEEQVEGFEKQIATLVLGYGEQAVFMEALVAQLAFATDEARRTFQEDVSRARKDMLEVMQSASKGFMAEQDPDLAAAIADMAESELSDADK